MPGIYITKLRKRKARVQKIKDLALASFLALVATGWIWTLIAKPV